jgi:hypothetical protein
MTTGTDLANAIAARAGTRAHRLPLRKSITSTEKGHHHNG